MNARRRLVTALSAVLVLAAVAAVVGFTSLQVKNADRTVSTKLWRTTEHRPPKAPAPVHPLAKKLLPVPADYRLGPDIQEYGNDTVLTSRQATAVFKEGGRDLPPAQRRAHSAAVAKLRLKGLGMRSYMLEDKGFPGQDSTLVAEVQLAQMANKQAAAGIAAYRAELGRSLRGFRKGPKIDGHRSASCFVMPTTMDTPINSMYCTATDGELLVTMTAYGKHGKLHSEAVTLLRRQLDRVEGPGEPV
ncbi:hypothetical protein [Streptomyces boninensis]|uniref:hypothetical protein n=1 Tax=Streptomyces boninensis TaxID=2039455 RepID=UPI003B21AD16